MKFSAKKINLIREKNVSAVFKIMNINVDFRIFVDAVIVYFWKNTETNKIQTKVFFENHGHIFVENAMILLCTKIQRKILILGKVGTPESSFWDWKLDDY